MSTAALFKWQHFLPEIILLNARWYCCYSPSYRDLEEMMQERGMGVDHSTINRWVLKYAPELNKRIRPHLKPTNDSWRVDETYIKAKGVWKYLYRAVDSEGNTLDFMLSAQRGGKAAARFLRKVLKSQHTQAPRVITVDKNAAYPVAIDALKADETMEKETKLRQGGYLNNGIEQEHRSIKRVVKPMMEFKTFNSARSTLHGIEAMNMVCKGQVNGIKQGDRMSQVKFIEAIFRIAGYENADDTIVCP
ncbi:IS6 family transposase [Leptolyngbya sp. FACHB-711]|uniref:IS6 family transposase n=1 Tax=unclassified Leptolyngbya TaxID=2650499 RepID=UPI00168885F9|nr:IS6 family transposase [Leptolyngbya sp. FACHB-711]MBD1851449.1 IS6 family transposase [Cyanobacteria bacterium FACHB-502]MBD2023198.1 IS6 family transposase [Leptolyngbya sp. FACHB-711]